MGKGSLQLSSASFGSQFGDLLVSKVVFMCVHEKRFSVKKNDVVVLKS